MFIIFIAIIVLGFLAIRWLAWRSLQKILKKDPKKVTFGTVSVVNFDDSDHDNGVNLVVAVCPSRKQVSFGGVEVRFYERDPLLPPSTCSSPKPTLVLDLDETLVHTHQGPGRPCFPARCVRVGQHEMWLALRPQVDLFLSSLAAHYELVVWTAGVEAYGRAVLSELDPTGTLISHSLFRQHCTRVDGGLYIKDLSRLGRDEARICDNNPVSFSLQPDAGLLVPDFLGDPQDTFLVGFLRDLILTNDEDMMVRISVCTSNFISFRILIIHFTFPCSSIVEFYYMQDACECEEDDEQFASPLEVYI